MPNYPTLMDIAVANGCDPVVGLIDETQKSHPEIEMGAARTIKGQNYKTLVRTALPTVAFRNANEGAVISKGKYENRLVDTFNLNPRWECDKAVADKYEDGPEAFIAMEATGSMRASMNLLSSQFYYGTGNDQKGFPGLLAAYDNENMVIDAGGTTDNTATSVWAVKFGATFVQWVWGENGALEMSDVMEFPITDDNGNRYQAYMQDLLAYPGLQVGNLQAVGRIKKITQDSAKGLTDDLISNLLELFPVGIMPDALFMTRRSLGQLRNSRTAVNITGAPAPRPTEAFNVPIWPTDGILNTEALSL